MKWDKYYSFQIKSDAVATAKDMHKKNNVPIKVIEITSNDKLNREYIVIPNPQIFFCNENYTIDLDNKIKLLEKFNGQITILELF